MKNLLNTNETIIFETKRHWILFLNPFNFLTLFIFALIKYNTEKLTITNKSIIHTSGFLNKKSLEINYSKIESINVNQSILGRLLGYGSINVVGSGGTNETFLEINNPLEVRKFIQNSLGN